MEKYKNWKALVFENEPLLIIEFGKDKFENSISLEACKKKYDKHNAFIFDEMLPNEIRDYFLS